MFSFITNSIEGKLKEIEKNINQTKDADHAMRLLRRDVNDLHSIIMLKEMSHTIKKKNRIIFVGTGQINENVIHAYIYLKQSIQNKVFEYNGDIIFIARSQDEYDLIHQFGFECEIWYHQIELAMFLLEAKVCVLSSHLYSVWGDNLLASCLSGAEKIELWHGLPAKTIGAHVVNNDMDFHFFTRLINDCFSVKHICVQTDLDDVLLEYKKAFPNAEQYITGDSRLDILIRDDYRKLFIENKKNKALNDWLIDNHDVTKVLYAPTYRETESANRVLYNNILKLLSDNSKDLLVALKLHPGIVLTKEQQAVILDLCRKHGHIFLGANDEVYSSFVDFDALITDYSSIRIDFSVTAKPVILWRFDVRDYTSKRVINPVSLFNELDEISIHMNEIPDVSYVLSELKNDSNGNLRHNFVNSRLKYLADGQASFRTSQVILDIAQSL